MNDVIDFLSKLGPQGLLAVAVIVVWRKYEAALEAKADADAARLADAQANTTKMLELYDRLHPPDDDRRMSRHD